jgi:hypothetical protein
VPSGTLREAEDKETSAREARLHRPRDREAKDGQVDMRSSLPTWIANPVVIPKVNGSGRLYMDFTSLNKACPKDPYPLPRIDQIVESTVGCNLLCFLDAFSGYHQIKMAREDEEKTPFITACGV